MKGRSERALKRQRHRKEAEAAPGQQGATPELQRTRRRSGAREHDLIVIANRSGEVSVQIQIQIKVL